MWYPPTVTSPPASEPVSLVQAKAQCAVDHSDDDGLLTRLIETARSLVEARTGLSLITQTVAAKCDSFSDLSRLPFGPVTSVSSVAYVDADGADQTLSASIYEVRVDGLDAGIVLKYGQAWPTVRPGSRITVTAVLGYTAVPPAISHAILMALGHWYANREAAVVDVRAADVVVPFGFDDLLVNFRLGV